MQGRYHDGETARFRAVEVAVDGAGVAFEIDGARQHWPAAELEEEALGAQVRLSRQGHGPARLTVDAGEWRAAGAGWRTGGGRRLGREAKLVVGLTLASAAIAAFVFIGMPLASGPLARHTPPELERSMGENFETQLGVAFPRCVGEPGQAALARFGDRLRARSSSAFSLRVRAVEAPMVNAFALPGGAIFVTDDLIDMAQTPDELGAVIAHEAAHVEKRHVMQAVWRSLGLGLVLDAVVGGGSGAGQQAVLLAGSFTDLRYSRGAEAEADARGQQLLAASGIASTGMAPFFERVAGRAKGSDADVVKELISTHPDSLRRAKASRARAQPGAAAFTPAEWQAIKASCKGGSRFKFRLPLK